MNNFDVLFDQIASSKDSTNALKEPPQRKSSFDEMFDQVKDTVKPERSKLAKAGRIAGQYALGALQSHPAAIAYDIATAPLSSKGSQNIPYREMLGDELENLMIQKQSGHWTEEDEKFLQHIEEQIKNPRKSLEHAQTLDIGTRDIAEKITGVSMHPEGVSEKAANFLGYIKNPKSYFEGAKELVKTGLNPKSLIKAILPTEKGVRAASAGTLWEMAEEGEFGPLGTMAAMIAGDLIGHGAGILYRSLKEPRKTAAQLFNFATRSNSKKDIVKQLSEDFNKSNLKMDAGTLTQSPLVQMMQSRLAQSGLVGDALDNARKELSGQITREYNNILGELGEITFENNHQASEAIKDALRVNEVNLGITKTHGKGRSLEGRVTTEAVPEYQQELLNKIAPQEFESNAKAGEQLKTAANDIKEPVKQEFNERWTDLNKKIGMMETAPQPELIEELRSFVDKHTGSLLLGESTPESNVVNAAKRLLKELQTVDNTPRPVKVSDLLKTKRTLADVANWEFGGSNFESAYKKLVADLDTAVKSSIEQQAPYLLEPFEQLNHDYSVYKDLFENKNVKSLFEPKNKNYNAIHNEFTSNPDKLKSAEAILGNSQEGQNLLNQAKRDYVQRIIANPDINDRQARNLLTSLGPQYEKDIEQYMQAKNQAKQHPLPRPKQKEALGIQVQRPAIAGEEAKPLTQGRAKETGVPRASEGARKKMHELLSKKSADQVMKQMDTVEGIRKLKSVLETTPEGKQLFKELSRFKIAEMIDNKMTENVSEQIKLGKFSGLLSTKKNQAIASELLGKDNFNRLIMLQKNAGRLAESAAKFFNASKSGTTIADVGLIGSAVTGLITGNPFIFVPALSTIGGSRIIANLLADPVFIKELEKAVITENPNKFMKILEKMSPIITKATTEALDQESKTNHHNHE